jgi:hypothetical protein
MRLDQDNYPETCKKILILNCPSIFRVLWTVAKPFFDPNVVSKMIFCSPGTHTKTVLSQYVDFRVLPAVMMPGIGQGQAEEGMPPPESMHGARAGIYFS